MAKLPKVNFRLAFALPRDTLYDFFPSPRLSWYVSSLNISLVSVIFGHRLGHNLHTARHSEETHSIGPGCRTSRVVEHAIATREAELAALSAAGVH